MEKPWCEAGLLEEQRGDKLVHLPKDGDAIRDPLSDTALRSNHGLRATVLRVIRSPRAVEGRATHFGFR